METGPPIDLDVAMARVSGKIGIGVWLGAMVVMGVTLLVRHLVALPAPPNDLRLAEAMASLRAPSEVGGWMAIHVLDAECVCSKPIADHLMASARPAGVGEHILLVGHDTELAGNLARSGLSVTEIAEDDLVERYHVRAVPLLLVVAPDGAVRYVGGYTDHKQGPAPRDLEIVAAAIAGRAVPALPVLGCAVGRRLQVAFNPPGHP
jgi:hypothetical protein